PGPPDAPGRMAALMTERVRWQLDGWLTGRPGRLPGALTHLVLVPAEVVPDRGRQLGFWGEETETTPRAARALARIQGPLGPRTPPPPGPPAFSAPNFPVVNSSSFRSSAPRSWRQRPPCPGRHRHPGSRGFPWPPGSRSFRE